MQPVEIKADASIHGALKHSTEFYEPDDRLAFCRQRHFGHRPGIIKIQHVNPRLIVSPENTGCSCDALHRLAKAGCPAVQPDLEYRRSDRDEHDRHFARTKGGVLPRRAIEKINPDYRAKAVTYDQDLV